MTALGRLDAVRATVLARFAAADTVRRALVGFGLDPARIVLVSDDRAAPSTAQVSLSRYVLHTRDCQAAIQSATDLGIEVAASLDSLGRCVQANNLAEMLADPGDLLAPPALEQQPSVIPAGAIGRARAQLGESALQPGGIPAGRPAAGPAAPAAASTGPAAR